MERYTDDPRLILIALSQSEHYTIASQELAMACIKQELGKQKVVGFRHFAAEELNTVNILSYVKRRATRDTQWHRVAQEWLSIIEELRAWTEGQDMRLRVKVITAFIIMVENTMLYHDAIA